MPTKAHKEKIGSINMPLNRFHYALLLPEKERKKERKKKLELQCILVCCKHGGGKNGQKKLPVK